MKTHEIILLILIIILVLVIAFEIFCFCVGKYIYNCMAKPHFKEREKMRYLPNYYVPEFDNLPFESVTWTMDDGYVINGDIYRNKNSKKWAIFAHGHASTREGSKRFAIIYYKLGYNVVLYDERGHGDNKRVLVTLGYNESKDLITITKNIREKIGKNALLTVFGYSMGGHTILMSLPKLKQYDVKYAIVDCPYSNAYLFAKDCCVTHHLYFYQPILKYVRLLYHIHLHISMKQVSAIDVIKNNDIPTLFVHGAKDAFILPYHNELLYNANKGEKEKHIFPNGTHGRSVSCDKEEYYQVLTDYIKRHE